MRPIHPKTDQSEHLLILALACTALVGSYILQPSAQGGLQVTVPLLGSTIKLPDTCMSRRILHIPCPGCGLTRSFVAFSQGKFGESFRFNLMGPLIYIICLFQIPYRLAELLQLGADNGVWNSVKKRLDSVVWLVLLGLLAAWVIRMI